MSIEQPSSEKVTQIGLVRRRKEGEFDPITASGDEVIARFLIQAGHFKDSDEAARYAATLLSVGDGSPLSQADYLLHVRLREIVMGSDISDDTWEDEDDIAGEIYRQLKVTLDDSDDFVDQRKALRYLLQLRGADIKNEAADGENIARWEVLLRKIGQKALG